MTHYKKLLCNLPLSLHTYPYVYLKELFFQKSQEVLSGVSFECFRINCVVKECLSG